MSGSGHSIAMLEGCAQFSASAYYSDMLKGYKAYQFIRELDETFDNNKENIADRLSELVRIIFNKANVIVSLTADDEIVINSQVGEVLLGENVYKDVYTSNSFSVQYDKSNFKKGDVNPTMYFDCVDNVTGVTYAKKDEDIEYNINFTQKLKVNTQADEAFNIYFGRNIDDLTSAVQNVLDIESQMSKVESIQMTRQRTG